MLLVLNESDNTYVALEINDTYKISQLRWLLFKCGFIKVVTSEHLSKNQLDNIYARYKNVEVPIGEVYD